MKPNLLLGCGVAAAAICLAAPAQAQERQFDIAPQPVVTAISVFGDQAGRRIVAPAGGLENVRSPGVRGNLSVENALSRLIAGTGLEVVRITENQIILRLVAGRRSTSSETEASAPPALEEIIVTAQKREEAAQQVPIALTAFSQRALDRHQLESLRDVSRLTPGLLVSAFNHSSPTIAVRGATNTFTQIGANKPVAVVVDDMFVPRNSAATFELFGLNSIQILKGPQGTLFGRNVTGGAIVIDTGRPDFDRPSMAMRASAGAYDLRQLDLVADTPLGEVAAIRIAGALKDRDGFGRDRLTGREQDDVRSRNLRGQLRLRPADNLEVLFAADYAEDGNGGRTLSSKGAGDDGDRRTSELGFVQGFDREQWGTSARLYWDLPTGQITSITGYRQSQSVEDFSGTGTSWRFLAAGSQTVNRDADDVALFSQEIRYASPRWDWGDFVAGAYFWSEKAKRQLTVRNLAAGSGLESSNILTDQAVDTTSYALFADGRVHLPANFELTLGMRYTHDRKTASLNRVDAINAAGSFRADALKANWSEFTPRAVLTWAPRPEFRAYASITRGFTAGGFNTDAATPAALTTPFDPETVTNYELGVKSQWLDNRLRVNAAIFQMDYKDKQELYFNNLTRILTITNAGEATIKGAEVELAVQPVRWLGLSGTYAYLDTVYDEFIIPGGAVYTGNSLGSSPRHTASLAADLDLPLGDAAHLIGSASWSHMGTYNTGAAADPNLQVKSYSLANAMLGIETADRKGRFSVWVRNLTNKDFVLTNSTQGVLAEYLGEPRTWGVTMSARF